MNPNFLLALLLTTTSAFGEWRVLSAGDQRQGVSPKSFTGGTPIKPDNR